MGEKSIEDLKKELKKLKEERKKREERMDLEREIEKLKGERESSVKSKVRKRLGKFAGVFDNLAREFG